MPWIAALISSLFSGSSCLTFFQAFLKVDLYRFHDSKSTLWARGDTPEASWVICLPLSRFPGPAASSLLSK